MWSLELTDLNGNLFDEIHNAHDRVFTFGISRIPTVQFKLNSAHSLVEPLMSADAYVKGYAGSTLMHHGIPTALERIADRNVRSVGVTSSGALWRLQKRLAAKNSVGTLYLTPTDRGQIAKEVIDAANVDGSTGILTGARPHLSYSTTNFKVEPYKPVSEVIAELGQALDGFDWQVVPIEYTNGNVGEWHAAPLIGAEKPEAVFEYGTGRNNISKVEDRVTLDTMANVVYHVAAAGVDAPGNPVVFASDATSIAERGRYEDMAAADLSIVGPRQSLVEEHVRIRRYPRRVISFTPKAYDRNDPGNVPVFGRDYDVGDWVRAHARDEHGTWFDGFFRVYQAQVSVSNAGVESAELVLTNEG